MGFNVYPIQSGILEQMSHPAWPCELWSWSGGRFQPAGNGTHFGAVFAGQVKLRCKSGSFELGAGMVFSVPGELELSGSGQVFGITHLASRGLFQLVGPVEERGRLRYIDGCTDSLLIPPQLKGEPCLNHLHFPSGIDQTAHTHPSLRAGLVLRGSGVCRMPGRSVALVPGLVFHIPADVVHAFATQDSSMDVVAFHPDSDFGPEHDDHPMINRTIVNGVSAQRIEHIRTSPTAVLEGPFLGARNLR